MVGQLHLWLNLIYLTKLKLPLIIKLCALFLCFFYFRTLGSCEVSRDRFVKIKQINELAAKFT